MKKVALIFGGPSPEHDVSLFSAKNIYQALKDAGLNTLLLGVTHDKKWKMIKGEDLLKTNFESPIDLNTLGIEVEFTNEENNIFVQSPESEEKNGPIDIAFPIVHGPFGEDGELQKILDELPLNYVGTKSDACITCMDKALTKKAIEATSIPQVPYIICEDNNPSFDEVSQKLGLPFFIKPARMGSSIGIHKIKSEDGYHEALADARIHDKKIVIEKGVTAKEIECAVLEKDGEIKVTAPAEISPNHEFYSYEAKYLDPNGATFIIPAQIAQEVIEKIKVMAKEAFVQLGCKDYARVDFFLTSENHIYFNELNTHPGFTNISQFPQLWIHEGLSYKELILQLLNQAVKTKTVE